MQYTALRAAVVIGTSVLALGPTPSLGKERVRIEFSASPEQTTTWRQGVQIVSQVADRTQIELSSDGGSLPDKQITFRVSIVPNGGLTFGPEDVWIEYGKGKRTTALSYEELAGRLRRDLKRRAAIAALGEAMSAGSANGYTTGSVSVDGTTSDGRRFSGSGNYSTYDPELARQQQNEVEAQSRATERKIDELRLKGEAALSRMLRRTTVKPFETISGIVAFDPPRDLRPASDMTIVVRLGDQEYRTKALVKKP
jgi:hypothetical protein